MQTILLTTSLAAGLLASASLTQQQQAGTGPALTRVHGAHASDAQDTSGTLDTWRERMGATDLAQREQHYDQMLAAARRDPLLRKALEEWANDSHAPDLAWTARLALRELEASPFAWIGGRGAPPDDFGMLFDFDSHFDFGQPVDARRLFEALQSQWDGFGFDGLLPTPDPTGTGPGQGQSSSSAESFSLSVGPAGVTCEVKRNLDGKEDVQEYKAESLEQLLEAHPELRDKLHVSRFDMPFSRQGFNAFRRGLGLRSQPDDSSATSPFNLPATSVRTDVLGVVVQPLTADEAKALGLEPGVGQRIDRVEPGTIANSMGLQRGHVLTELNGSPIKARDDITTELKKRVADGALEAVVIDRWGQRRTHTWKPDTTRQL